MAEDIGTAPQIEPITPTTGDNPRSQIYSEEKLRNDYRMFMDEDSGEKPIGEVQKALFDFFMTEEGFDDDNQAYEYLLGRKHSEFDDADREILRQHASPKAKQEFGHIWKL